jgi:hypothetical protein
VECSPSRRWLVDGHELCASDVLEVGGEAWLSDEAFKEAVADDGGGSGSGLCIALVKKNKKKMRGAATRLAGIGNIPPPILRCEGFLG